MIRAPSDSSAVSFLHIRILGGCVILRGLHFTYGHSQSFKFGQDDRFPHAPRYVIVFTIRLPKMATDKSFRKSQLIAFDNVAAGQ